MQVRMLRNDNSSYDLTHSKIEVIRLNNRVINENNYHPILVKILSLMNRDDIINPILRSIKEHKFNERGYTYYKNFKL